MIFFGGMPILSPLLIFLPVFFFLLGFLLLFPGKFNLLSTPSSLEFHLEFLRGGVYGTKSGEVSVVPVLWP